jgi:hypothetical protein
MKKIDFFYLIIALLIITGLGYGIYFIGTKVSTTFLTLLSGAIGFIISKFWEASKENKQRTYDKKREVYLRLLKIYKDVLTNKKQESNYGLTDDSIKEATEAAFDAILYASDEVVRNYGTFRNTSVNNHSDPSIIMKRLAILLKAMRKDLGNQYSSLDEVEILKMFINLTYAEEKTYRDNFKKII